tara:strand:- start:30 stop:1169 length:1140 start_codon:yes stop_codon:yes gene_type:complete
MSATTPAEKQQSSALLSDNERISLYLKQRTRLTRLLTLGFYTFFLEAFGLHHLASNHLSLGILLVSIGFFPSILLLRALSNEDRNDRHLNVLITLPALFLAIYFIYSGSYEGSGLLWCYPLAMILFNTPSLKTGIILNAILLICAWVFFYADLPFLDVYPYRDIEKSRFILSFFAVILFLTIHQNYQQRLISMLNSSREALQKASLCDDLTGLPNRRYMNNRLSLISERQTERSEKIALLLIDLDHFKQLNEAFGYQAGDHLLLTIGSVIQQQLRRSDEVVRWGGDEFMVLLGPKSTANIRLVAENVRSAIENHSFEVREEQPSITASIAGCAIKATTENIQLALQALDKQVIACKQQGRNRVGITSLAPSELRQLGII